MRVDTLQPNRPLNRPVLSVENQEIIGKALLRSGNNSHGVVVQRHHSVVLPLTLMQQSPLDTNRIDAWRDHLAAADVALIERITAPVAMPLGYAPTNPTTPHMSVDPAALWRERQIAAMFDVF